MPINIEVGKETIDKLYEDAVSAPAKELGKLGTDVAKTARLLLAPLQLAAVAQARFEKMIERISKRVPEERRMEPPAELVGPTLEKMRYLNDDGALWRMFEEVLSKAIDKDGIAKLHPSFPHIISQLSRDEAWILFRLRDREFKVVDEMDYDQRQNRFYNRVVKQSELPAVELYSPDAIDLVYSHLESLNLVTWPVEKQIPITSNGIQTGLRRDSTMRLTDFGRLFVNAAIPDTGFEKYAKAG